MNDDFDTRQEPDVYRPSAAINPERLDYLWSLSERIASSSLVPESLRTEGNSNNKKDLPREQIVANVFAVCEQADRWNMSPFALLSCAAIVHGKLGFEGKVIAAVLEANFGIVLHHYFTGTPGAEDFHIYLCDTPLPDDIISALRPNFRVPGFRIMDGSVSEWKTTGNGSPWRPATYGKMLVYRGTREWSRVYKAAAIMGVLGDDELMELDLERRASSARNVTPSLANRFGGQSPEGFNQAAVKQIASGAALPMERFDPSTGELIDAKTGAEGSGQKAATSRSNAGNGRDSGGGSMASNAVAGQGPKVERREAAAFHEHSKMLLRFSSAESVGKAHDQFWEANGGKPEHPSDVELVRLILSQHSKRTKGEITSEVLQKDVAAAISKSFEL